MDKTKLMGFSDEAAPSIEDQVRVTKELGWSNIELRTVNNKQIVDLSEEEFKHTKNILENNGVRALSLGSNIASWAMDITRSFDLDKELVEKTGIRAKELNSKFVRIMSYKILIDKEGKVLEDQKEEERFKRLNYITSTLSSFGLIPVHENCFTYGGLSPEHTLKLIKEVPGLRLAFDTGNPPIDIDVRTEFPYSYQNSMEFYQSVKPYISHVHIKDSRVQSGKEVYYYPGEGDGRVNDIIEDLILSGYDGYFSIEPHMETVFHNIQSINSNFEKREKNYKEYAQRLEKIIQKIERQNKIL